MKYILVKSGERQPSTFSDFKELVNYVDDNPQVGFYTLVNPGVRLVRNRKPNNHDCAFAIVHYVVDAASPVQHESYHYPINSALLMAAADKYDYVMAGIVTSSHLPSDEQRLINMQYIARRADGVLVNVETELPIRDDHTVTYMTAMFGFVRVKGFPAYYMIINDALLHVTDGFDFFDVPQDTLWMLLTEHDGAMRDRMFMPEVSADARLIGSTIMVQGSGFDLKLFDNPCSVFRNEDTAAILANASYKVTTNLKYNVVGNVFKVDTPYHGTQGFIELEFDCGRFFAVARPHEKPTFKYVVLRIT